MIDVPNLKVVEDAFSAFDDEYNIEATISKYKTINTDLIEFAKQNDLDNPDDAAYALFIADYIITSSEVPPSFSDDDRRASIIAAFIVGLQSRNQDSLTLTKVVYLSQKIGTMLKRYVSFLSARGLEKNAALVLLKDTYISPYMTIVKKKLGDGPRGWELGLLASAIKQASPSEEVKTYMELTKSHDEKSLFDGMWQLLKELEVSYKAEVNENMVIPNIAETKILYASKFGADPIISLYSSTDHGSPRNVASVNDLFKFLERSDSDKPILFMRGTLVDADVQLIMARNPYIDGNPLVLFETNADEINLSEVLSLLSLRSNEHDYWNRFDVESVEQEVAEKFEETETLESLKAEPVMDIEVPPVEEKKGFLGKLFGRFKKSESKAISQPTPKKVTEKPKKKPKPAKPKQKSFLAPDFLGHALGVAAVGDLGLFEIFDTFRETEYLIVGTMESDFINNSTTFQTESRLGNPEDLANVLDGLDSVVEATANEFFGGIHQIMPTEIFFLTRDDKRLLITLKGNEDRLVGTIAITHEKDITKWQDKQDEEPLKRRSLHMRTGQLLSSRAHTPFDASVERIYAGSITNDTKTITLNHAILSIDN